VAHIFCPILTSYGVDTVSFATALTSGARLVVAKIRAVKRSILTANR
jgi:hypothetical protein